MSSFDLPERPRRRSVADGLAAARHQDVLVMALALGAAACVGFLLTRSALLALVIVVGCVVVGVAALVESLTLVKAALAALPWFVVFADFMPPLVKTFTSAGAVLATLLLVSPVRVTNPTLKTGVFFFLAALLVATLTATAGNQFIQSAKYLLFPAMAVAVISERGPLLLPTTRRVLLTSGTLAVSVHVVIIALGLGAIGTKYGAGERLGFVSYSGANNLALLSMIVATAGLAGAERHGARFVYVCLGTVPAVATGVRSAFVAAVAVMVVFLMKSRLNFRSMALTGGVVVVLLASGVLGVAEKRYRTDQTKSEFSSLSTAGSGRGAIWTSSFGHWEGAGPAGWAWGTGLRSIERFELQRTGNAVVGHSDVIEVGVQLGILGFVGWVLIWLSLFRARLSSLVLIPIAVYAIFNGVIEYVDSLVFGLALAAACAGDPSLPESVGGVPPDPSVRAPGGDR
jgi:hypothetical protein